MAPRGQVCPPGVFCITPGVLILFGLVCILGIFMYIIHQPLAQPQAQPQPQPIQLSVRAENTTLDSRFARPPRPQRLWDNGPEIPTRGALMAFNQSTRGLPESYQMMGVLKTGEGQMLPLYGRRTAGSSDRYNYYTRTDTNNPVPLPLTFKRKDCQDDVGCDELMSGDTLHIIPTGQRAEATLYRFDGPMYVPAVF
jgi:Family of unknown function (DUF5755)